MKKKRNFAAALRYDKDRTDAPVVKAKGYGHVADQIKKSAEKSAIPVQKDPSLAELLSHLHMNEPIPEHLYEAVAEVFAFIYQVEREMKEIQTNGNDRGG
ncbi:EscU/YscU/HrcU family type III secretion system export apparatus switch protein [Geomicrobium sp. JSM 1781026]|uniref:EscU/YscU/HrcU family type III secretion system export apparatus switch protein n=1 Tax=Geomicrobium sp. JSM 1781026 TaxID=3344580 RepID=UPI0035C10D8A